MTVQKQIILNKFLHFFASNYFLYIPLIKMLTFSCHAMQFYSVIDFKLSLALSYFTKNEISMLFKPAKRPYLWSKNWKNIVVFFPSIPKFVWDILSYIFFSCDVYCICELRSDVKEGSCNEVTMSYKSYKNTISCVELIFIFTNYWEWESKRGS